MYIYIDEFESTRIYVYINTHMYTCIHIYMFIHKDLSWREVLMHFRLSKYVMSIRASTCVYVFLICVCGVSECVCLFAHACVCVPALCVLCEQVRMCVFPVCVCMLNTLASAPSAPSVAVSLPPHFLPLTPKLNMDAPYCHNPLPPVLPFLVETK